MPRKNIIHQAHKQQQQQQQHSEHYFLRFSKYPISKVATINDRTTASIRLGRNKTGYL